MNFRDIWYNFSLLFAVVLIVASSAYSYVSWDKSGRFFGQMVAIPQNVSCTCSDDPTCGADATAGTLTLQPTADTVRITNPDPNGCDVTMSETGAVDGDLVRISVVSNTGGTVDIAESAGVIETTGNIQLGIYDMLGVEYVSDRWVEAFESNN